MSDHDRECRWCGKTYQQHETWRPFGVRKPCGGLRSHFLARRRDVESVEAPSKIRERWLSTLGFESVSDEQRSDNLSTTQLYSDANTTSDSSSDYTSSDTSASSYDSNSSSTDTSDYSGGGGDFGGGGSSGEW